MNTFNPFADNGDPGLVLAIAVFNLISMAFIPIYVVYLYLRHERRVKERSAAARDASRAENERQGPREIVLTEGGEELRKAA